MGPRWGPGMTRSVFVTGGYGLLGAWLVRALVARGDRVVLLQRDRTPRSTLLLGDLEQRVDVVHGDLTDPGLVARALGEYEVDTVFHLAAQTIVGTANRSPLATFETNVRGTWLLLEACRLHGAGRVLVAASDKAYGASATLPYREDHPLDARFPYDVSKAATDLIARSYWHTYGLPVAVTRFANLYGGGDLNRSRLVPEAIGAALAGRAPVIRSDGTPERDFLYVEDAVAAYLLLADALDADPERSRGEAFNAGGGEPHAVRDVVARICAIAGTDVKPDIRGRGTPDGEIDRQYVDPSKLSALTGWAPAVGLDEGLERTVAWYRDHPTALI
ncbi:NAD-dependent epimerase/dehydratase family protein [Conexibacter sp. CPCC 206217]|uniref:NAD-dependent epimerase/dehydratase family protein n=1 Tax=Conexibacter sp. CPCC 206217 TaxID=3064574 RepID=UPI00271B0A16|nr:NAD-dependent epimerase/dehydratase family protein [Conexibacter sp. CPCC 206217]MDO8210741.1 GDP-mannose 4,6-dehydratase [Conexibacter sp. CPCC 206217]